MAENANLQAADSNAEDNEIRTAEQKNDKPKKNGKKWVLLTAAVLAAGGAAAGGICYAKHRVQNTDVKPQGVFSLRLTDETDNFGRHSLQRTEDGFYTYKNYLTYEAGSNDGIPEQKTQGYLMSYTDAETGEYAPLCARPNCTHDGSLFCPASTKAYRLDNNADIQAGNEIPAVCADGYLYTLAEKPDDPDFNMMDEVFGHPEKYGSDIEVGSGDHFILTDQGAVMDKCHEVLIRYEPDGTGIEEIHDFGVGEGCCKPVCHRGYLWFSVQLVSYGEITEHPITHEPRMFVNGGYEIWGYELKTGELVKVFSGMGDPTLNHVDLRPSMMFGSGDYLIFQAGNTDWVSGGGFRKLNLLTGELTAVPEFYPWFGFNSQYGLRYVNLEYDKSAGLEQSGWYRVDLFTDEKTLLPDIEKDYDQPLICDHYIVVEHAPEHENEPEETDAESDADAKPKMKLTGKNTSEILAVSILDLDGNKLADVPMPELQGYPDDRGLLFCCDLYCVDSDTLYLQVHVLDSYPGWMLENHVVCCPIRDILDGKCEWKRAFEIYEEKDAREKYEIALEMLTKKSESEK